MHIDRFSEADLHVEWSISSRQQLWSWSLCVEIESWTPDLHIWVSERIHPVWLKDSIDLCTTSIVLFLIQSQVLTSHWVWKWDLKFGIDIGPRLGVKSMAPPLSLSGLPSSLKVKVHPAVLLTICDSYVRRSSKQTRVIGTLLGQIIDGTIEVKNCYAVPHSEAPESVSNHATCIQFCWVGRYFKYLHAGLCWTTVWVLPTCWFLFKKLTGVSMDVIELI